MSLRLGWFSSGREDADSNLFRAVMSASEKGTLDVSVSFVFCDYDEGEAPSEPGFPSRKRFVQLVRSYDVPIVTLSWQKTKESWSHDPNNDWRVCFGKKMRKAIYERPFELGIVVGFSTPMDADSCTRFDLIGLYPSLPTGPRGNRDEIICKLIRGRADRHGAMVRLHRSTGIEGAPVSYCSFPIKTPELELQWADIDAMARGRKIELMGDEELVPTPLFKHIYFEEERRELPLVTNTIKLFADGELDIVNGRLLSEGMAVTEASDLSKNVDSWLHQRQL
jgi:phosphoribosylglycinamide formyltransferase-1